MHRVPLQVAVCSARMRGHRVEENVSVNFLNMISWANNVLVHVRKGTMLHKLLD